MCVSVCVRVFRNSEQVCLCVLSPHRLAILALSKDDSTHTQGMSAESEGVGLGTEPSYSLVPLHTHQLRRTAANMTWGYFDTQNSESGSWGGGMAW